MGGIERCSNTIGSYSGTVCIGLICIDVATQQGPTSVRSLDRVAPRRRALIHTGRADLMITCGRDNAGGRHRAYSVSRTSPIVSTNAMFEI